METVKGYFVDIFNEKIFKAVVSFSNGKIVSVTSDDNIIENTFILPGFVNSHVHIESSMLTPDKFAELALARGTVAVVSDPHEIANVMGVEGINFMINNAALSPMKFYFGVPSCVPATNLETSGFIINSDIVEQLLKRNDLFFLSEMMNFPGVINDDNDVVSKIKSAHKYGKSIDGHAPFLSGENLKKYASAGITTDHESSNEAEAEEKIKLGIKLQIREGSAAKNFDALYKLIDKYPNDVMLCTDDSHPDDLTEKHIDELVRRGVYYGLNIFNLLKTACINPVIHYKLDVGLLRENDNADFIVVDNLKDFNVLKTYINGNLIYSKNKIFFESINSDIINNFVRTSVNIDDFAVNAKSKKVRVIVAKNGELYTPEIITELPENNGLLMCDISNDILKIVVINRYNNSSKPSVAFVKGFGIKKGAIASSIAHDSHNIIAVGTDDNSIFNVVNSVIKSKGGIVAFDGKNTELLSLPIAGLMSNIDGKILANRYKNITQFVAKMGSTLKSPFMTLSFMALLVIPELKLGDKGLFKINDYTFVDLQI